MGMKTVRDDFDSGSIIRVVGMTECLTTNAQTQHRKTQCKDQRISVKGFHVFETAHFLTQYTRIAVKITHLCKDTQNNSKSSFIWYNRPICVNLCPDYTSNFTESQEFLNIEKKFYFYILMLYNTRYVRLF